MRSIILTLTVIAACFQAIALPATYQNPIIKESIPDPTVLRAEDGFFYLMGTEDIWNIPIFRSPDLVNWTQIGTVFDRDTRPAEGQVWAPELCHIHGKYVLFYSVNLPDADNYANYLGYAVADHPSGPWTNRGKLFDGNDVGCDNTIDPFYFSDAGKHYLFWGSTTNMWAMEIQINENIDLSYDLSKKVQTAGTLIEGTEIYKRGDWYYMFASIGSYAWTTYRVVVGRSKSVFGPYKDRNGVAFLKGGDALNSDNTLTNNNYKFTGNGHNAPILTDGAGDTWFICHGHVKGEEFEKRMPLLDKLYWDENGWPYLQTGSPAHAEQEAPQFPSDWVVENPSTSAMSDAHGYYDVFQMSPDALRMLESSSKNKVTHYAPESDGRSITRLLMRKYTPRPVQGVDNGEDYQSYFITGNGLSSIVFNSGEIGIDLSHVNSDTRLRIALRTDAEPELFGMDFFNNGTAPAFSFAINGYATGYPVISHWPVGNGWIGLDIPFSRIAEICPGFEPETLASGKWTGDYLKIQAGRLKDSNFSIDAFYLYTPAAVSGVEEMTADSDSSGIGFDGRTVKSCERGIEVLSISGHCILRTDEMQLDLNALQPGIYLCRSGNRTVKIALR